MKVAILGGGNMGGAIARGLSSGSMVAAADITVADISQHTLDSIHAFNSEIKLTTSNRDAVVGAKVIIIAVKPWVFDNVVDEIQGVIEFENQIIVSIAAGIPFADLNELIDVPNKAVPTLFRVIPNIAIAISESMTVISAFNATEDQKQLIKSMFDQMGKSIIVEERLMEAGTALGSCGTAFALRYLHASMQGGVELGLYPDQAKEIVAQTMLGAVNLLLVNGTHPEVEIDKVTTPGGITIKGLNELEHFGFTSAIISGLKACK